MTMFSGQPGEVHRVDRPASPVVRVFFLSDSTGISAETMGNALLLQFPGFAFERRLYPFISTPAEADKIVAVLDAAAAAGPAIAFSTTAVDAVRERLHRSRCELIDFFDTHMSRMEELLGVSGVRQPARLHGIGDAVRYNARMAAVEYALEHDDGQSRRALEKADVILIGPSRCGKTPTTMYLALQHGLLVANYPLVDEDLRSGELPGAIAHLAPRLYGITTTAARLAQIRTQRRADSRYSSLEQCTWELRQTNRIYSAHRIPHIDSSTRSVEEMSTVIIQNLAHRD
ncbi:pyruvate, water dikinase regulatory protein [Herbiconiux daphne]|uniref:Putative phosphoenolpyruvate synthase regulatory protein n=1 Tax=Herbiconiux daphne TaxID=2970914 RepID=A0ABT2H3T0_9MICO|nr:pyruvate, water dikinase regulatory protein [Herbiconiux daphne]MCS5734562.1 kinase/pyrophosphorylase [Herbiconiux daphne]